MEQNLNSEQDLKDYLAIIYGENVKVIFNSFVFTWEESDNESKNGYLLTVNGDRLITERIDDIIEVINSSTKQTVGYVIFLKKQLSTLYNRCKNKKTRAETFKDNVLVISSELTFERAKIQSKYYSKTRPDIVLAFNYKKYLAKFDEDKLKYFMSPS